MFFFIELASRRVHFAGRTAHPSSAWVNHQARQVVWVLEGYTPRLHFRLNDNDSKLTEPFDTIFAAEQIDVLHTPVGAPNANAVAQRCIRTVRNEGLDKLLIFNQAHWRRVLRRYIAYYNVACPHQALAQQTPIPRPPSMTDGQVCCRRVLGGIQNDYYRAA